jgi:hypothetical protein
MAVEPSSLAELSVASLEFYPGTIGAFRLEWFRSRIVTETPGRLDP